MKKSRFWKNSILSILIVSLLIPSAVLLYPYEARAEATNCALVIASAIATVTGASAASKVMGVPSSDMGTQAGAGIQAGSGYGTFFKDCVLIPIAIRLAKAMLQNITMSLVNWINSGFHGSPSFVQNLRGLVNDTIDQTIGGFIANDLGAGFLCSPFSLQVKIALAQSYLPYRQREACTLTQITNNVNGFIDNNNGTGWENWLSVTTQPQNNVYGATILAQNELSNKIAQKLEVQNRTLDWGKGFRSWDVCTEVVKYPDGTDIVDNTGKVIEASSLSPDDENCADSETRTPGTSIEKMLGDSLGSGMRQLEIAQDIDAIVGALTNQLMSKVITGAAGLLGAGKNSTSVSYTQALSGTISDTDLENAINTGVGNLSNDANLDAIFSTDGGTTSITIATSTVTETVTPATSTGNVVTLTVTNSTPTVNASTSFAYAIKLGANYSAKNLNMRTTLRQNGAAVPFLGPVGPFSTLYLTYGRSDGTSATKYISSTTDGSAAWSNVSVTNSVTFDLKVSGTKRSGGSAGTYSLETVVTDSDGRVVRTQTNVFVVQ